ncbi:MAG TPA: peptidylprolyl isomerase [Candidatus Paceibacterota bacterium]|nr:peptidylprolyl isomerase [Candidatus Paceibacterota bacterium]
MKILTKSLVVLCAAAPLFSVCAADEASTNSKPVIKASDLFTNSIVAKAKGVTITRSQLDEALIQVKTGAASRRQQLPPDAELQPLILQRLIQVQILLSKATDADKTVGKEAAQKRIADLKKQAGDEMFVTRLKTLGVTESELAAKMGEELTAEAVLKRELGATATDEDAKKFYDENPGKFEKPEMVRAAHVLIGTKDMTTGTDLSDEQKAAKKKIAEDVLKKAKAGEDFAKLAKEYSDDPGSKDKGGEYTFPRGQMMPEFESAAFSLNTNQVSDIVTTTYGYHIIKTYEKLPAKKIEFDEVKSDIKEFLANQKVQKGLQDFLAKLEKDSDVQILDEKLKPAPRELAPPGLEAK